VTELSNAKSCEATTTSRERQLPSRCHERHQGLVAACPAGPHTRYVRHVSPFHAVGSPGDCDARRTRSMNNRVAHAAMDPPRLTERRDRRPVAPNHFQRVAFTVSGSWPGRSGCDDGRVGVNQAPAGSAIGTSDGFGGCMVSGVGVDRRGPLSVTVPWRANTERTSGEPWS